MRHIHGAAYYNKMSQHSITPGLISVELQRSFRNQFNNQWLSRNTNSLASLLTILCGFCAKVKVSRTCDSAAENHGDLRHNSLFSQLPNGRSMTPRGRLAKCVSLRCITCAHVERVESCSPVNRVSLISWPMSERCELSVSHISIFVGRNLAQYARAAHGKCSVARRG